MMTEDPPPWEELLTLLGPFHDQARASARRLCRCPQDGDDLFHETLLRAGKGLGGLRERERFRAWFYAVLLSVHRERARRSLWRRFLRLDDLLPEEEPPDERGVDDDHLAARRAAGALAGLPAVMREAIVLYEVDGFSVEEIASMQGVSTSAVKSRLARGRTRLRQRYERAGLAPTLDARMAEGKP